jgi:hypothetical protein
MITKTWLQPSGKRWPQHALGTRGICEEVGRVRLADDGASLGDFSTAPRFLPADDPRPCLESDTPRSPRRPESGGSFSAFAAGGGSIRNLDRYSCVSSEMAGRIALRAVECHRTSLSSGDVTDCARTARKFKPTRCNNDAGGADHHSNPNQTTTNTRMKGRGDSRREMPTKHALTTTNLRGQSANPVQGRVNDIKRGEGRRSFRCNVVDAQ